ncbi:MAG: sensor histidine kinase [Synechococcus sp.]|uniref:sensor histidine kinase n=1 Tax=Synechococcus sp. BMK-MC-1 TaxID=1442551 RepID=UPI0016466FD8|nr:HAMP domain-containing sensor histidine kinase [Synechococcus sp. BMK-MC-1]QNI66510.1 two-component sensor histidine kinase [Synechococcus sp. BMK-MC-1]
MHLSDQFLALAQQHLNALSADGAADRLALYLTERQEGSTPSLTLVAQSPEGVALPDSIAQDPSLRSSAPERRWYPLRYRSLLLGVLRAEQSEDGGQAAAHNRRLQTCAETLACIRGLELEQNRLNGQLDAQRQQLSVMVHQLRNPLTALRTYAQLLLRRLGPDDQQRPLVENLIREQVELDRYVTSLDRIGREELRLEPENATPLLLPPVPADAPDLTIADLLRPLIDRAAATATLQGRLWRAPQQWPRWTQTPRPAADAVTAEIVANLLENAFRYSPNGCDLGLYLHDHGVCVWDAGPPIPDSEREQIFLKGVRGSSSSERAGSGLGLALAQTLARQRGGQLELLRTPADLDHSLPNQGNAFLLSLPPTPPETPALNPPA